MIIDRNNGVVTLERTEMERLETMACRSIYMECKELRANGIYMEGKEFHASDGICLSCPHYIVPIGCTIGEPYKNWKGWEEV